MQGGNNNAINYSQYSERYNTQCQYWRSEPVQDRKVNNPCCLATFIVMTLAFLGFGGYFFSVKDEQIPPYPGADPQDDQLVFVKYMAPIISCIFGSIVVSLAYIVLIKLMPKVMVYVMILVSLGVLGLLGLVCLIQGVYGAAIPLLIILLIYICALWCFKDRIRMGIVLVKVATQFISAKPIIFITPIFKVILTIIFAVFWIYTFSIILQRGEDKNAAHQDTGLENAMTGFWVFLWLFYSFLFYYIMVFTIAVTCAFWYYDVQGRSPIFTAYKWIIKSALGALTFAALLIAIITIVRMIIDTQRKNTRNIVVAVCLCLVSCLMRQIEALMKVLNHNTVICMAVTGQDYIDGAKTAIGIICSDLPLFSISRIITNLLVFWGIILSVGIPTFFGFLWINGLTQDNGDIVLVVFIIVLASIMISGMIFSILAESVSCVFVFYCFDRRFKQLGFQSHNMPNDINLALSGMGNQADKSYARLNE